MGDRSDEPRLLPGKVYGALTKIGKNHLHRAGKQYKRNLLYPMNGSRGVSLDVLGVLQSYPGGERQDPACTKFFDEVGVCHEQLLAWVQSIPSQRQQLLAIIQHLQGEAPDIPAVIRQLQQISDGIDVYSRCERLAPVSAPAQANMEDA